MLCVTENDLLSSVSVGDRLTDGAGKGYAGMVENIVISPALAENQGGVFSLPHKSRVILTISAEGIRSGGRIQINGMELLTGKRLFLHGRGLINGICLSVNAAAPEGKTI